MHLFLTSSNLTLNGQYINEENGFRSLLFECAGHGANSVGDSPTTGIYRQVQ